MNRVTEVTNGLNIDSIVDKVFKEYNLKVEERKRVVDVINAFLNLFKTLNLRKGSEPSAMELKAVVDSAVFAIVNNLNIANLVNEG